MGQTLNPVRINVRCGVQGFFKFESVNPLTGRRTVLSDWIPNQILDAGRNIMADFGSWANGGSKCQVGTSDTLPSVGDTQLFGYVAGTSTIQSSSFGAQGTPPYYGWNRTTYRFAVGAAEGNISEAGVGWNTADGPYLISRALIVDGLGDPTTVTVLDDEYLDVTYELRYYPPLTPVNGTQEIDGVMYNTITTAANVTGDLGDNVGQQLGVNPNTTWVAYDGDLGTIVQAPDGLSENNDNNNNFNLAYVNNSYEIDMQCDVGSAGFNLGLGIRSILIKTNAGQFQTQFDAQSDGSRIPKTTSYFMSIVWTLGWDFAVLP